MSPEHRERPGPAGSDVAVIGAGYVGLTTAACLAHLGHRVLCADIIPERVEALSRGEVPIVEQGLDQLVAEGLETGRLQFVLGAAEAARTSEFVYLSVPTPQGLDGAADLSFIEAAAREIGPVLPAEAVVINKSTVPVGSTRVVEKELGRSDVYVVSNPEFLREGSAVSDFLEPDRVVIGSDDQSAAIRVAALYVGVPAPLMVTDPASAETIKYASNAFLATKLSFVNAVAAVCEAVGADVNDVVLGMGYDQRIGHEFLKPGPGWGGSCFDGAETLVVRRGDDVTLVSFEQLAEIVDAQGLAGLEVLSWSQGDPTPQFAPVAAFTRRSFDGPMVTLRTKMGRRLTVTADHPMVVNGPDPCAASSVKAAGELTAEDWLPIATGAPLELPIDESRADRSSYAKALPEGAFALTPNEKRRLLRGLWDGDGSWSLINGGPSVVLEYGTVSRRLADGMLRLLGELGIVARLKVGRVAKSTVDTYWIVVSGTEQVAEASTWLFPSDEAERISGHLDGVRKRIQPTGYRHDGKNAAWVRVVDVAVADRSTTVYSVEVPGPHTVVATHGLVAHNCFPKDSSALVTIAENAGYDFGLLKGVITVNEEQFDRVTDKIVQMAGGDVRGRTVAVWGLTFKARTDDLRESPSLEVIRRLLDRGATIKAHDPTVNSKPEGGLWDQVEIGADPYAACDGAEVLAVLTEWDEYRWLDFDKVADVMASPRIVDTRNLLERAALLRRGFHYVGIGRG